MSRGLCGNARCFRGRAVAPARPLFKRGAVAVNAQLFLCVSALRIIDLNVNVAPILVLSGLDGPLVFQDPSIAIVQDVALIGE
jgi:hypothetical protein